MFSELNQANGLIVYWLCCHGDNVNKYAKIVIFCNSTHFFDKWTVKELIQ